MLTACPSRSTATLCCACRGGDQQKDTHCRILRLRLCYAHATNRGLAMMLGGSIGCAETRHGTSAGEALLAAASKISARSKRTGRAASLGRWSAT